MQKPTNSLIFTALGTRLILPLVAESSGSRLNKCFIMFSIYKLNKNMEMPIYK